MNDNNGRKGRSFSITIDGRQFSLDDPVVTGRQLLNEAGMRPVEEHLIYYKKPDGLLEDIGLEESVDLRERGVEEFITFNSDRSFRFELDSRRQDWGKPIISEEMLRDLAEVGEDYRVWMERKGEEDLLLDRGALVDLTQQGVERFYTGRNDTTAGGLENHLPIADRRYLSDHGIEVEVIEDGPQKGILTKGYHLPEGRFDHDQVDLLVVLPAGYPDTPPDMFFTDPWVRLVKNNNYPQAADQQFSFGGRNWQRWSRHNQSWRPGIDGIHTMLRRVDGALRGNN